MSAPTDEVRHYSTLYQLKLGLERMRPEPKSGVRTT